MATFWPLGCDADDPQRITAFWALALGYVEEAKNRMHVDINVGIRICR